MKLCALIGNGLSIAYSPALSIPALTAELVGAFENLGGSEAADALRALPATLTGTARNDFEALLSPFESGAQAFAQLTRLAKLVRADQPELAKSLRRARKFLVDTHAMGLGVTLSAIAEHSRVRKDQHYRDTVLAFMSAVTDPRFGSVDLFTPNYDNLLHSACIELGLDMCDLADGRRKKQFVLAGEPLRGLRVRATAGELMATRVRLVNLHGSLNWLADPATGEVWKFLIDELRDLGPWAEGYWDLLATGRVRLLPSVVLTDRKEGVVQQWPYSLAYDLLSESFASSSSWLIAGYSFGDKAINLALRRASALLTRQPEVLIVGKGKARDIRFDAEQALGPHPKLYVSGRGIPACMTGAAWHNWQTALSA